MLFPVVIGDRRLLLHERHHQRPPGMLLAGHVLRRLERGGRRRVAGSGKRLSRAHRPVEGETDLPHVAQALRSPRGLAGRLHRRQQEADQRGDDRDHHKQFNERERSPSCRSHGPGRNLVGCNPINIDDDRISGRFWHQTTPHASSQLWTHEQKRAHKQYLYDTSR